MSEFERAVQRAEAAQARRLRAGRISEATMALRENGILQPPPPVANVEPPRMSPPKVETRVKKGKTNEILMTVYLDGREHDFIIKANLSGNLIGSQRNRAGLIAILHDALTPKFGRMEIS